MRVGDGSFVSLGQIDDALNTRQVARQRTALGCVLCRSPGWLGGCLGGFDLAIELFDQVIEFGLIKQLELVLADPIGLGAKALVTKQLQALEQQSDLLVAGRDLGLILLMFRSPVVRGGHWTVQRRAFPWSVFYQTQAITAAISTTKSLKKVHVDAP